MQPLQRRDNPIIERKGLLVVMLEEQMITIKFGGNNYLAAMSKGSIVTYGNVVFKLKGEKGIE
jgi:hypothetical protein